METKNKYSPAPWQIEDWGHCLAIVDKDKAHAIVTDADCHPNYETTVGETKRANAKLIAAAPSMYEGIKALNLALDNYWNATVKTDKLLKDVLKQQKNCWEIITQATS